MGYPDFQEIVNVFVTRHELEAPVEARLLDLTAEVGELAKELLKGSDYGAGSPELTSDWAGELGDVFFSLICLANSTDVNLDDALEAALEKYQYRLSSGGDAGSGE